MAPTAAALFSSSPASAFSLSGPNQHLDPCNPSLICKNAAPDRLSHNPMLVSHPLLHLLRVRAEPEQAASLPQPEQDPDPTLQQGAPSNQKKQSVLEALDFAAIRSEQDAQLLEDARSATAMGGKMSPEQYAALKRKIGGTYRDFFKDSIEVEGEFVDEGWVDKSCRFCKKETASEPRTVDKYGRYAHVTCVEKSKSGNFFTRLFGM